MSAWPVVLLDLGAFELRLVADPSMPRNTMELRSGAQRIRVRWADDEAEIACWEDDGGATS
jgi:hypothetical protein